MAELAETNATAAEDMDLETLAATPAQKADDAGTESEAANGEANSKRAREEEESDGVAKKTKVEEKSAEEKRLEKLGGEGDKDSGRVSLGPKSFASAVEMFDYFYKLLHHWPTDLNINKVTEKKSYLFMLNFLSYVWFCFQVWNFVRKKKIETFC